MLVLSRKTQQSIVIDGRIRVTIQSIQGGRVRVGIEAPQEMPVHRGEIADRIESATASTDSEDDVCLGSLLDTEYDTDYDLECCEA